MSLQRSTSIAESQEQRECRAFCEHLNSIFESSEHRNKLIKYLPLNSENIFAKFRDGVLLAYLLESLNPGNVPLSKITHNIDLDMLNKPKTKVIFEVTANLNVCVEAAKSAKLVVVNIGANDILDMNKDLVLGLVWQIVRAHLLSSVNLASHPELIRLLHKGENLVSLLNMKSEQILLRWLNYHLSKAGVEKPIENFSKDLADCQSYAILMNQIAPRKIAAEMVEKVLSISEQDKISRANMIIEFAELLECNKFVTAKDIASGNSRLNLAFTATLFNKHIGIQLPSEEEIEELFDKIESLEARVKELETKLNAEKLNSGSERDQLAEKVKSLEIELEATKLNHEEELDRIQKEIEDYKEETTKDFNSTLESKMFSEKHQYEETIKSLTAKEKEFRNSIQRQWAQLKMILAEELAESKLDTALPTTTKKPLPMINVAEVDQLVKEVIEMAKNTVSRNKDLSSSVKNLYTKIEQKERINEIMGDKIREYTTLMINEKKSRK